MSVNSRSVITIATGKKIFIDMACNLAMSFLLWNDVRVIPFYLVTDQPDLIPQKLTALIQVIAVPTEEIGTGFSSKLHIDRFAFTSQVLFVDADCLIYDSLQPIFDAFSGHDVSVIGYNRTGGKDLGFCGDIAAVIKNTGTSYFPLLCGSLYYLEKGQTASAVFACARSLLNTYEQIGLVRLRGKENEEPLIAIAMARFGQQPVNDTGMIKADRMFYEFLKTNVLRGEARLWNKKNIPVPEYSTLTQSAPLIVHFNAYFAEQYEYGSEVTRLRQVFLKGRSHRLANLYAALYSEIPGKIKKATKDALRPLFQRIAGHRKIKPLKRI